MVRESRSTLEGLPLRLTLILAVWIVLSNEGLASAGSGSYVLHAGDTVHVSAADAPELNVKAALDIDGYVHLPLVPSLKASGMTLQGLLTDLREALRTKMLRQRLPNGEENNVPIDPDGITVEIAEYRPVYVRGDVSKPGELPFRPGITVRQAIALSGGYDVMRFRMENPFLAASDLRAQYQNLWTEFARDQARARIVQGQLDDKGLLDPTDSLQVPISNGLLKAIVQTELQQAAVEQASYAREKAFYQRTANAAHAQIASLTKPRDDAQSKEADDLAYRDKLSLLLNKGVIAHEKVADQQRFLLDATQRYLDYAKRMFDLQNEENDAGQKSAKNEDERRTSLLKTLQETNMSIANNRANIQAVGDKLLYTGAMRSQLVDGRESNPLIKVFSSDRVRGQDGQTVSEDTVLEPGDVVEVSLSVDLVTGAKPMQ